VYRAALYYIQFVYLNLNTRTRLWIPSRQLFYSAKWHNKFDPRRFR